MRLEAAAKVLRLNYARILTQNMPCANKNLSAFVTAIT